MDEQLAEPGRPNPVPDFHVQAGDHCAWCSEPWPCIAIRSVMSNEVVWAVNVLREHGIDGASYEKLIYDQPRPQCHKLRHGDCSCGWRTEHLGHDWNDHTPHRGFVKR